jgi:5-methylcytosine-specific restriction endonuclease McrA
MSKKTLQVKLKNTLRDAPLVPDPVSSALNKEETPSVQDTVRTCNTPEVDLLQHVGGQDQKVPDSVRVFVLNMDKEPLMPTSSQKARLLLKTGRAVVVRRSPFTIQLKYVTGNNRQEISCGVDSGYTHIGFSCITEGQELIRGEVEVDRWNSKHLTERQMYRRNRRSKLRYREPRFLNRRKHKGWLPPSIERRYQTHIHLITLLNKLLPISDMIVETASFDIQKLNNPDITNIGYRQGSLYEKSNLRSFILAREKNTCQLCNEGYSKTDHWHKHHIIPRSQGGTDKPDNIALLHEKCHDRLHEKGLYKQLKKNKQYKEPTFMNIIKDKFKKDLNCKTVFGYETFVKRNELQLKKSHSNDAFVIAGGSTQDRSFEYLVKQKRRNNRSLQLNRKGSKPSIRRQRYSLQPGDLVKVENEDIVTVIGSHCLGIRVMVLNKENKKVSISIKNIKCVFNNKSLMFKKGVVVNSSPR